MVLRLCLYRHKILDVVIILWLGIIKYFVCALDKKLSLSALFVLAKQVEYIMKNYLVHKYDTVAEIVKNGAKIVSDAISSIFHPLGSQKKSLLALSPFDC